MALTPTATFPGSRDGASGAVLSEDTTFYVATTGSDSDDGLTDSTPLLTIQRALEVVGAYAIGGGVTATIQLADGTYVLTELAELPSTGGTLSIMGNTASPSAVVVRQSTAAPCFNVSAVGYNLLSGVTLNSSVSSAQGVFVGSQGNLVLDHVVFGANLTNGLMLVRDTGVLAVTGSLGITASTSRVVSAVGNCAFSMIGITVTITNTPAWSSQFALVSAAYARFDGCTFSGSATGVRYIANQAGLIFTNGGGANFLPGNSAGSVATNGQYL